MKDFTSYLFAFIVSTLFLSACSLESVVPTAPTNPTAPVTPIPSTPQIPSNPVATTIGVDNDYWFGTIGGVVYGGLGFKQTGTNVSGVFAYVTDTSDVSVCCTLSGTIQGQQLSMSYVDRVGDTIMITGIFTSAVTLTGSLTFIIDGVRQDPYTLNFSYEGELDDYSRTLVPKKSISVRQYYEQLSTQ